MITLCTALNNNNHLKIINVRGNNLVDKHLIALSEVLCTNSTLQYISMAYNEIGDKGLESVLECLAKNTGLTHLELQYNKITSKGKKLYEEKCLLVRAVKLIDIKNNDLREEVKKKRSKESRKEIMVLVLD